jgi:hypothetical protein
MCAAVSCGSAADDAGLVEASLKMVQIPGLRSAAPSQQTSGVVLLCGTACNRDPLRFIFLSIAITLCPRCPGNIWK